MHTFDMAWVLSWRGFAVAIHSGQAPRGLALASRCNRLGCTGLSAPPSSPSRVHMRHLPLLRQGHNRRALHTGCQPRLTPTPPTARPAVLLPGAACRNPPCSGRGCPDRDPRHPDRRRPDPVRRVVPRRCRAPAAGPEGRRGGLQAAAPEGPTGAPAATLYAVPMS